MNGLQAVLQLLAALVMGYLLGSFPSGYLAGKLWGVDVRQHGSGRTGGTNVWRASGTIVPALLTGLGDILKGVLAVVLARHLLHPAEAAASLAGVGAVCGHIWPLYLRFKGGAGGATAAASWITLSLPVGLPAVLLGLYVLIIGRYASLGTLTVGVSGLVLSVLLWILRPDLVSPWYVIYAALIVATMALTLQPNLRRLRQGTERRITLW